MNLKIELPPQSEEALRAQAAAAGMEVESYIRALIEEQLSTRQHSIASLPDRTNFADRLDDWIRLHPQTGHFVDDSRESIYEGCGE